MERGWCWVWLAAGKHEPGRCNLWSDELQPPPLQTPHPPFTPHTLLASHTTSLHPTHPLCTPHILPTHPTSPLHTPHLPCLPHTHHLHIPHPSCTLYTPLHTPHPLCTPYTLDTLSLENEGYSRMSCIKQRKCRLSMCGKYDTRVGFDIYSFV